VYIIINFRGHRRHNASLLQRPTSEFSSWRYPELDVRNMLNTNTDCVDKMQSYFYYTRYQAAYITRVDATSFIKGKFKCPTLFCRSLIFHLECATVST